MTSKAVRFVGSGFGLSDRGPAAHYTNVQLAFQRHFVVYSTKGCFSRREQVLMETKDNFSKQTFPHYIAGAVLPLCATSHVLFLRMGDPNHGLPNQVFPFMTNRTTYAAAALMESIASVVCFAKPGRALSSIVILTFVALVAWYRIAFYYVLHGATCNCLGILGRVLRLDKTEERVVPIVILLVLALTTVPWRRFGKRKNQEHLSSGPHATQ